MYVEVFKGVCNSLIGNRRASFDMMNRLVGFNNLRICIVCSLILIVCVVWIRLSNICLLDNNMQNRLLDILEIKVMFLGETIFPIAKTYSF